ncbi:MAG: hypothetical protein ABJL55_04640 [Roseibium sp.]
MLYRFLILVFLTLPILGCKATIDANHAHTDAGFVNSGLRSISTFYIWNTSNNVIRLLESGKYSANCCQTRAKNTTFTAGSITNFGVKAEGNAVGYEAEIAAAVSRNAYIKLANFEEKTAIQPKTDLHDYMNVTGADKIRVQWQLDEAIKPSSNIRYLKIVRAISATEAEIYYKNQLAVGTEFPVKVANATIDVEITASSLNKFEGGTTPAIIEFAVYKVIKTRNANNIIVYRFVDDTDITDADIATALKN